MKQAFSSTNLRRYLFGFMAVFIALFSIYSTSPAYAQDQQAIHQYRNDSSEYKACSTTATTDNSGGSTVVLDPGHSGTDKTIVDPDTGLHDHDYPNPNENEEMFYVALLVKAQLVKDGYKVILTKGDNIKTDVKSVTDPEVEKGAKLDASLRARAEVANSANAAIAVSLHNDHGQSWDNFAQIFVQREDGYRIGTKGKVTFSSLHKDAKDIAAKSQEYGKKFEAARSAAEGRDAKITVNSFDNRPGIDPGNMAMVEMFSNVPWVYNEIGAAPKGKYLSDTYLKKYAQGVIKGIEASVPISGNEDGSQGTATQSGNITSTSITMQRIDLNNFKPDPKAVKYFNETSLEKMKDFIPWYVEAAQLEGVPQNWEILAALHGPELGYGNYYKSNGYPGDPSGPFQEKAIELKGYLDDPDYGPVLKTLITADGKPKPTDKLTKSQFVVLGRLAYHRWVAQALGKDYDKLKKGPIAYEDASSDSFLARVMSRWNSSDPVEGFNGFDTGAHKYNPGASVWPGMATTYYLLKQWEANGGMATISVAGSTGADCNGTASSGGSVDCTAATGRGKILCEAKRWNGVYYLWGGGHGITYENFKKKCPDPTNPPNNKPSGAPADPTNGGQSGNPSPCGVDCSGLVHMALAAAFGKEEDTVVQGYYSSGNWKKISLNEVQAGDLAVNGTIHVEIVESYTAGAARIKTFGAHRTGQADSTIDVKTSNYTAYFRYVGPGV